MLTPTRLLRASWTSTLHLPKSSFPARPLPSVSAEYLRRCSDELYAWQQSSRSSPDVNGCVPETFTLHDGPPYANGPLHIGHALNKITKDIICRFQVGQGKKVSYIPGWDCHGLPIEIKALQAQNKDANMDAVSVRKAAGELATRTVEEQMRGFREWAVMGDWNNAYRTMERGFEIRQLEVFRRMFEKGLIYRQFKPVYWSPSSRTALAEAELEYDENHKSLAAFVRFPVTVSDVLRKGVLSGVNEPLNIVIWTTTPWTLPANKAIAVHKDIVYSVVQDSENDGELTIVAASRLASYQDILKRELIVVQTGLSGSVLAGNLQYENPFQKANGLQPVIHADFVTDLSGTGLVHIAPGHGMDDYHACSALGIPAFAPVDDTGAFTKEAFPSHPEVLEGKLVQAPTLKGQPGFEDSATMAIVEYLTEHNLLRALQDLQHKYPIDWRTKQPVIVRATEQWFANVDGIKERAMRAIDQVEFIPHSGRSRLESFVQSRSQWCISRQRAWGVPIPALYRVDEGKHEATMDSEIIRHILEVVRERGIDAWWTDPDNDPAWTPKHLPGTYVRGRDTMDVWFDSGTSWTLLPPRDDQPVADIYLEGTDQHRGWFQSSLLTYVATHGADSEAVKPPFKTLITHGFTLDSDGRKMSKSLGNVISPSQITSGELLPPLKRKKQKGAKQDQVKDGAPTYDFMGPDALRLWVAGSDYTTDVTIGQPVLQSVNQTLHKYRVTFKWLLGIFSLPTCPPIFISFNAIRTVIATHDTKTFPLADQLSLHRLQKLSQEVHTHYTNYEFFKGVNAINKFITNDLSAFYFETLKDRVYAGTKQDCQHIQSILALVFYELMQALAPICPLLVEEVWDHVPGPLKLGSVHPAREPWTLLKLQPSHPGIPVEESYYDRWNMLSTALKAAQERLRAKKKMGSSLECSVVVGLPESISDHWLKNLLLGNTGNTWNDQGRDLANLFVVSEMEAMSRDETESLIKMWRERNEKGVGEVWWEEEKVKWKISEGRQTEEEILVVVAKPRKFKCPRCWRFLAMHKDGLCGRCESVVKEEGL
ncbi:isoleucyl-tRNA synthetase-like protein [Lindgomyces ingoldianus]|uniref:Isoleucyl-tRNA synthetase-like protein n=1 Tax=Lindgomyces ingoldianus TaxID=673940 RepID=A0ACB6RC55_9PLEO|nr:isoleucyl-tRNA synthetase-like protein [Lindgomyces ingoldianus]KAF2476625.1 isoleucyl-tRNA synthetase-like protein [Lindgomyces ingoldianus]